MSLKNIKDKSKIKNKRIFLPLAIIVILLIYAYGSIISNGIAKRKFALQCLKIYENNKDEVFKIDKIVLCSSANAIDLSEEQNLQDLSIYQYTDIAIYLDNGDELTSKNTVKDLYISDIYIEGKEDIGKRSLYYKNILNFGLKEQIDEIKKQEDIYFKVIHTNEENENADYNQATFYTDCSNPITLEYLDYDIKKHYQMSENKSVTFDGNILQDAEISPDQLACKVKFRINIVNNENQKYSCAVNLKIPLDDIYQGTTMKSKKTNGQKYVFFRES